ncbi:hypothetical protein SAMN05421863_105225 [Nitrosomonas communis]|uniref:Uncharacterized protein n=1 Tax=Nitrosomonas communis TaxID=44574 RepID=A0A1I4TMG9_9PROT|nr:hypothetical protein SAMN05421863_105225 [Nitrosomonas communis]
MLKLSNRVHEVKPRPLTFDISKWGKYFRVSYATVSWVIKEVEGENVKCKA